MRSTPCWGHCSGCSGRGCGPVSSRLADHTGLEPLYVSKLARTLETAGLVERTPDPGDTRAVQLSLTEEGHRVTLRAVDVVRELLDQQLAPLGGLDGADTGAFIRTLTTLLDVPVPAVANKSKVPDKE